MSAFEVCFKRRILIPVAFRRLILCLKIAHSEAEQKQRVNEEVSASAT